MVPDEEERPFGDHTVVVASEDADGKLVKTYRDDREPEIREKFEEVLAAVTEQYGAMLADPRMDDDYVALKSDGITITHELVIADPEKRKEQEELEKRSAPDAPKFFVNYTCADAATRLCQQHNVPYGKAIFVPEFDWRKRRAVIQGNQGKCVDEAHLIGMFSPSEKRLLLGTEIGDIYSGGEKER